VLPKAVFSSCGKYRYMLSRTWTPGEKYCVFVGLNPSTADEEKDDPTIRRCISYAQRWGYGGMVMLNLFAFRSTDPKGLLSVEDPVGPENDTWFDLIYFSPNVDKVVAAWGVHGSLKKRDQEIKDRMAYGFEVFGLTKEGHPKHPLYLKKDIMTIPWITALRHRQASPRAQGRKGR
jgi:hypothetical protein